MVNNSASCRIFPEALLTPADTCLVEIARRDCSSEPNHRQQVDTKPSRDVLGDSAIPSPVDEEPCESHYLKAKEAYSAILDNIGCICKVLLSLNLDSCCVAGPAGSLRVKSSTGSTRKGLLGEMSMVSSARSRCKPQEGADCSKRACCSDASSTHPKVSAMPGAKCTDADEDGCCGGEPLRTSIDQYAGTSVVELNSSHKTGCGTRTSHTAGPNDLKDGCCSRKKSIDSCCSGNLDFATLPPKLEDCSNKECCSDKPSAPTARQTITDVAGNPADTCCADGGGHADAISDSRCTSDPLGTVPGSKGIRYTRTGTNEFDLEKGEFPVEHVLLSVQGMTCTGCEKTLYGSLDMIPEISNVKTSLLLAQAEFDLSISSATVDTLSTIKAIEKMTGFTCTKMTQSGHVLDLIVDGLPSDVAAKDLPYGVSDIAVLDTHHPCNLPT